jgi:hypothetical protein
MLSILCHFHGLLFARAALDSYSYIDQRNGPYSEGMFVVIVVDECIGDFAVNRRALVGRSALISPLLTLGSTSHCGSFVERKTPLFYVLEYIR